MQPIFYTRSLINISESRTADYATSARTRRDGKHGIHREESPWLRVGTDTDAFFLCV
jgi:hypothetical protein